MNWKAITAGVIVSVCAVLFAGLAATRNRAVPNSEPQAATAAPQNVSTPASEAKSLESVPRVSATELRESIERGDVVVIDVRDIDSYTASHIAGASHIPLSRIEGELPWLRGSKPIVTYCT
jgi:high-affinity K+ transport system ATPase subunit B